MALNDFSFLILFVVLTVFFVGLEFLKKIIKAGVISRVQVLGLLVFSYYFLYCADWRFCLCVVAETMIAYICAMLVSRAAETKKKRIYAVWGGYLVDCLPRLF